MSMEKQWIRSERAHFMCPNMHFGILAHIKAKADMQKIEHSFDVMSKAHPFLRSMIKLESDHTNMYYDIGTKSSIQLCEKKSIAIMWEDYGKVGAKEWNVFENGLLKVFVYPMDEEMNMLFISHHLLVDGRGLLELVNEFVQLYIDKIEPVYSPERLISGMDDLPANSDLTGISKYLVRNLNKKWRKEKTFVTYEEYAKFADQFVENNPVSHEIKAVDEQTLISMKAYCKDNNITMNDLLMAKMYLAMDVKKIIIAADVRNKIKGYHKGACGNYATAMGIVSKKRTTDVLAKAKDVHRQVKLYTKDNQKLMLILSCYLNMDQNLIDAAAIATLGEFKSKTAKFVGANMFGYQKRDGVSITNLGRIQNSNIIEATFIPPASPAMIQTIGVLTVNDRMQLCSSYYEHAIPAEKVKIQLNVLG